MAKPKDEPRKLQEPIGIGVQLRKIVVKGVEIEARRIMVFAYALDFQLSIEAADLLLTYVEAWVFFTTTHHPDLEVDAMIRSFWRCRLYGRRNERSA